jgi:hypothetical protein
VGKRPVRILVAFVVLAVALTLAACGEKSEEGDHTYGEWITTKKATVGVEGLKERSCITCGYTQSQKIPATSNPATGDNAQLLLWTVLLLVSACGLVTVVAMKKRQIG